MKQTNEQNVVKMNNYRTDTGFSALSQVESYWEALRGSRLVPKRSEIDPRGIEHALEYTFVLERIAIGMARFRIAGSHLCNIMGMEVRGMPLSSFITPSGRETLGSVLEDVFQNLSACELEMEAEVGRKKPAMEARMVLMPLRSDLGDVSRILGCFVAKGELGTQPRRFEIVTTKLRCLSAGKIEQYVPQQCEIAARPSGFREKQTDFNHASVPTKAPHLRLIKTAN
ncbi:PAS domain-containing protein [Ascidiaceihabitans sp.]|nr:PAS domain-containing protein [Ascidiaceihabitans sp.]